MAIVPSGKRRLMVAQTMATPEYGIGEDFGSPGSTPAESVVAPQNPQEAQNIQDPQDPTQDQEPGNKITNETPEPAKNGEQASLRKFILSFYADVMNFPPRSVMKHKEDIVVRDIDAEGQSSISIIIPNEYYGSGNEFDRDDVARFANTIKEKFDLFFMGAKDDGKVWKFEFTSREPENQLDAEEMEEDPLASFLGQGSGDVDDKSKKPRSKARTASRSMHELVKYSRNELLERLMGQTKNKG